MSCPPSSLILGNLRRWKDSGQPRRWVEARHGQWDHQDWVALLAELSNSEFGILEPAAVGAVLEQLKGERLNLSRWRDSEQARQWVAAHQGAWSHYEWLTLLESLRKTDFWPLDAQAVATSLEAMRREWQNLRRWRDSGAPHRWVEAHAGGWDHRDWLELVDTLRQSEFWPLHLPEVGRLVEQYRRERENLQRWLATGAAWAWVERQRGQWDHPAWAALVEELRHSEFWPLESAAIGEAVEQARQEWLSLRRWVESGQPRAWVEARHGQWSHHDWLALLASLQALGYGPLPAAAVGRVLEEMRERLFSRRPPAEAPPVEARNWRRTFPPTPEWRRAA